MKNTLKIAAIAVVVTVSSASALAAGRQDSVRLRAQQFQAKVQAPTTQEDETQPPKLITGSNGGELSCPAGYALTTVKTDSEKKANVSVPTECNGVSGGIFGAGYVHTWCRNSYKNYNRVYESPSQTYTCQKIKTKWVKAGSDEDTSA